MGERPLITAERLREVLHYDPVTGVWTWLKRLSRGVKEGKQAGCRWKDWYLVIRIDGRLYLAHRLAYLYMTGEWPPDQIDHKGLVDKGDCRWENLRPATNAQNMCNTAAHADSEHGVKGISLDKRCNRWAAKIMKDGVSHYLGYFPNKESAAAAYQRAALELHGEFARV